MKYLILVALCLVAIGGFAGELKQFNRVEAYWLLGTEGKSISDLSGLAICNGKLLTISDKVSDTIFEITFSDSNARVVSSINVPKIPPISADYNFPDNLKLAEDQLANPHRMDWEAITCTGNTFYLISEEFNAILKIKGGRSEWLNTNWYPVLSKLGYLTKFNAFVEGLIFASPSHFYVALEREPRGLLEITWVNERAKYTVWPLPNEGVLDFHGRTEDVADLAEYKGRFFFLERNAAAICERDLKSWKPKTCFSFKEVEENPEYKYADQRYGMAEGLAVSDDWVYIVYDNNGTGRFKDGSDHRTLLLKTPTPQEWK